MPGTRPDCMKTAPPMRAMVPDCPEVEPILVHTRQLYDLNMRGVYFTELELPQPNVNLEVGSGSHAWITGQVMLRLEPVLLEYRPDWVVVAGAQEVKRYRPTWAFPV